MPKKKPSPLQPNEVPTFAPDKVFVACIKAAAIAASKDDCRPILTLLHIKHDGTTCVIESTDSYRLYEITTTLDLAPFEAVIPARWLAQHIGKKDVEFWGDGEWFHVSAGDQRFSHKADTLPDQYPMTRALYSSSLVDQAEDVAFNPAYYADLAKAVEILHRGVGLLWSGALVLKADGGNNGQKQTLRPFTSHVETDRITARLLLMPVRLPEPAKAAA